MINNKGFTLVELLIAITIITILSSVRLLSYNSYYEYNRNTKRIEDFANISKNIELYASFNGQYPDPDGLVNINYSGGTLFKQGYFGDNVKLATRTDEVPFDKMYNAYYSYSITSNNKQFQLGTIMEEDDNVTAYLKGNYNNYFSYYLSGSNYNFISIPSIILSSLSNTDIMTNTGNFVIDSKTNIPETYKNSNLKLSGNFYYTPELIYSTSSLNFQESDINAMSGKLQNTYSGITALGSPWNNIVNSSGSILYNIIKNAFDGLYKGSYNFAGNTPLYCSGTTYSGTLFNNYAINTLNNGESRIITRYENTYSGSNISGIREYILPVGCNNGNIVKGTESKRIHTCFSGYTLTSDNCE